MTDPIALVARLLQPHVDAPVRADRIGHQVGRPLVLVALAGMDRIVRYRLERADFTAHCTTAHKHDSLALAMSTRQAIHSIGIRDDPGVVVTECSVSGPFDMPDEDTREQRFVLNFTLFYYYETGGH